MGLLWAATLHNEDVLVSHRRVYGRSALTRATTPRLGSQTYVHRRLAIRKLAQLGGAPLHAQAVAYAIDQGRVGGAAEDDCTTHLGGA